MQNHTDAELCGTLYFSLLFLDDLPMKTNKQLNKSRAV